MADVLVAMALEDAQKSTPPVRAAALMRIARVQAVSDVLAARETFDIGLAEARLIEGNDGESLMEAARMLAAAVAPDRLKNIGTTARRHPHFMHEQFLSGQLGTVMIEHGDAAFEYVMSSDLTAFPFGVVHSLMQQLDDERQLTVFRRAIEAWRANRNDHPANMFSHLFQAKWELLPLEEARTVAREIVQAALEDPDRAITAKYDPEGTTEITSGREHRLFQIFHILRRVDQPLAESLIAGHQQLANAARRFPNGMESVMQEAEVRRKNSVGEGPGRGFGMIGNSRDFSYLRALMQASDDGDFRPAFAQALERYSEDSSASHPNQALKSSWPSSCMFCSVFYRAGKRLGEDAMNYVGQIPDADLRLFARIEFAAALAGLPELRMTQRVFRPDPGGRPMSLPHAPVRRKS
jgi:hypothetical protein